MKKFNWSASPGIVVGIFFIWLGITNIADEPVFFTVWLFLSGFSFYRSLRVFLGLGDIPNHSNASVSDNQKSNSSTRLQELENLYNQGLITRDEFEDKRQKILDEL